MLPESKSGTVRHEYPSGGADLENGGVEMTAVISLETPAQMNKGEMMRTVDDTVVRICRASGLYHAD